MWLLCEVCPQYIFLCTAGAFPERQLAFHVFTRNTSKLLTPQLTTLVYSFSLYTQSRGGGLAVHSTHRKAPAWNECAIGNRSLSLNQKGNPLIITDHMGLSRPLFPVIKMNKWWIISFKWFPPLSPEPTWHLDVVKSFSVVFLTSPLLTCPLIKWCHMSM